MYSALPERSGSLCQYPSYPAVVCQTCQFFFFFLVFLNSESQITTNLTQVPRPCCTRHLCRRDLHLMSTFWPDRVEPFGWRDLTSPLRSTTTHPTITPQVSLKPPGFKDIFHIFKMLNISPHSEVVSCKSGTSSCYFPIVQSNPTVFAHVFPMK
jgi:hypothetical protein